MDTVRLSYVEHSLSDICRIRLSLVRLYTLYACHNISVIWTIVFMSCEHCKFYFFPLPTRQGGIYWFVVGNISILNELRDQTSYSIVFDYYFFYT